MVFVIYFSKQIGNVAFLICIHVFSLAEITVDTDFFITFTVLSFCLNYVLLLVSHKVTHWAWDKKLDPDTVSLPYVTSVSDLLGTVLIVVTMWGLENLINH